MRIHSSEIEIKDMNINSTSEALTYLYQLSLNQTSFGFRGQADKS